MVNIAEFADKCDCDIDLQCLLGEAQAKQATNKYTFIDLDRIQAKYKSIRESIQTKQAQKTIGVQL